MGASSADRPQPGGLDPHAWPSLRPAGVLGEVVEERGRQDAKWGEQNHPDVDQVLMTRPGGCCPQRMAEEYEIPSAIRAKTMTDGRARAGDVTWAHIAVEELAEAVEAAALGDEDAVRTEVIQLAAVCVQWVQAIDRRRAARLQVIRDEQTHAAALGSAHIAGPQL